MVAMIPQSSALPAPAGHACAEGAADRVGGKSIYRSGIRVHALRHIRRHAAPAVRFPALGAGIGWILFEKCHNPYSLFPGITLRQALEGFDIKGFVERHFMHSVIAGLQPTGLSCRIFLFVDSIEMISRKTLSVNESGRIQNGFRSETVNCHGMSRATDKALFLTAGKRGRCRSVS